VAAHELDPFAAADILGASMAGDATGSTGAG
jgi:hypothetical protein